MLAALHFDTHIRDVYAFLRHILRHVALRRADAAAILRFDITLMLLTH